jgi:plastocyanin
MKKLLLSLLLFLFGTASFCTTWTITNSGDTFVPATLTIVIGDSVNFVVEAIHKPVEVSQATWNANGNTPLPGGFDLPFGGGFVLPALLGVGTHYYVCSVHVSFGMKGTIIVQSNSGINNIQPPLNLTVSPNPASTSITISAGSDLVGSQYMITDQAGRQVITGKLTDVTTPVDISQLTSGIYMIQVAGIKRSSIKLIKK